MRVVRYLSALALKPYVDSAGAFIEAASEDAIASIVTECITEHRQRFTAALEEAFERAWKALEIALAGEALWERLKAALRRDTDHQCRQSIRAFLDACPLPELAALGTETRQQCFDELRAARMEGVLTLVELEPLELAQQASTLADVLDPQSQREAEQQTLDHITHEMRQMNFPALGHWLTLRLPEHTHPLVLAARYFLQKAVEADQEIALGFPPPILKTDGPVAGLAALEKALTLGGQRLEELIREVRVVVPEIRSSELSIKAELPRQDQQIQELGLEVVLALEKNQMGYRALRPRDSLSIVEETDRQPIRRLMTQFHALPEEQRRQLPALLNGIGMLEVAIGQFEEAQRDFQTVTTLVSDAEALAEAHYNAYQTALERCRWNEALEALGRALTLAPERFAPFPPAKYEAERILGAGGFGVTFLCRNRHSGSRVVIKALRVDGLERDVAEVFRDVQVLEEIDHPSIIRTRDCDYVRGDKQRPFLVMDFFDGPTLADHVKQHGSMAPAEVLTLVRPLAEALQAAHARGVWHRDLKPANLLVRRDGARWEIKLIDFGLGLKKSLIHATIGNPAALVHTPVGHSVTGLMDYLAPEQMGRVDEVEPGPYSDIYSFGKICTFALLRIPDPDDDEKDNLPEAWRKLLNQCTARIAAKRPANFTTVLQRLSQLRDEAPPAKAAHKPKEEPAGEIPAAPSAEPKDAAGFNERGLAHAAQRQYDRALADFTRALELDPRHAEAFFNRGDSHRHKGEHDKAVADYTQALHIDPKFVQAFINLGRIFRQRGDLDRAVADFTRAIRVEPKCADAYNNRGNAYADKGEYDRAIADYDEALRLDPSLAVAYMNRGLAHTKKKEFAAVVADCGEAIRLSPKLAGAYFIRGAAHSSRGEHDKAIADFTRVLRLNPRYALAYNDRGLALAHKGEYDRAIADYTQALQFDPKLALAYMNRAIAYRLKGDHDRSIRELTKLLRLYPKNATAYNNRGLAFLARRDFDRAIADFTEVLWIDPNNTEAYNRRIEATRAKSERVKTEQNRRERDSKTREELERRQTRATAHYTRGQMHFENGQFDKAAADFTEAIKFDPDNALFFHNRGLAFAAQDQREEAMTDFSEALRLDPKLAAAYYQRGVAYRLKGNYARAVADFSEALRLDPKFALAYRSRGLAHASLGEQARAKADYEEAVRLDPSLGKK